MTPPFQQMLRRQLIRYGEAVALVAVGGLLGANLRYALGAAAGDALAVTLLINTLGSFGLGLLLFDARAADVFSKRLRYVFGTGFFASFTTYSTFVADIALTAPPLAAIYLVASYLAGFGGVILSRMVVARTTTTVIEPPMAGEN